MTPKILIADDDPAVGRGLGVRLRQAGYQTHEASDGLEAIRQFDALRPDVVLLDASMPGVNGLDVCQHIRQRDPQRRTAVILISGASVPSADYVQRCASLLDCDAYLRKPYHLDAVLSAVRKTLVPARTEGEKHETADYLGSR